MVSGSAWFPLLGLFWEGQLGNERDILIGSKGHYGDIFDGYCCTAMIKVHGTRTTAQHLRHAS